MMSGASVHPLDFLFHPRSVAIVGISGKKRDWNAGKMFLNIYRHSGFTGPIYPVSRSAEEIKGLKCYPSLVDIPGPVDYVISSIPATGVLQLMDDAAAKGVRCIHFFTAGFSETGEEDGEELERRVLEKARSAGIRLIGPNCMGLYCPSSGLSFGYGFPHEPGPVAFISQSGLNAEDLVNEGKLCGVRFSKVISFGNAADLNESDFFEYCTADPETQIIISYIEGVKEGGRFLRTLKAASAAKPVIILKGGLTGAGSRAARSHTGSLAGSPQVWDALCRQAGVLSVESLEDLVDMAITFRFLKTPAGRGLAIIVIGGGASVLAADSAEKIGLRLPALSDGAQAELRQFTPIAGTSVRNPLDTVAMETPDGIRKTVEIVGKSPGIDAILILTRFDWGVSRVDDVEPFVRGTMAMLAESVQQSPVPVALAVREPDNAKAMAALEVFYELAAKAGVAAYPDYKRALNAIAKFIAWQEARADS